jgi:hypothetical protein
LGHQLDAEVTEDNVKAGAGIAQIVANKGRCVRTWPGAGSPAHDLSPRQLDLLLFRRCHRLAEGADRSMSTGLRLAILACCLATPVLAAGPDPAAVTETIKDWPRAAQDAAREMLAKYGPPQEMIPTLLIWKGNAPWVRTVVSKVAVEHDFPSKHEDVLEQTVEYRVPLNAFEAIATFDGSVIPDRTRGELIAHCDHEATNILALNLARDIIRGEKTPQQARDAMAAGMRDIAAGRIPDDAKQLRLGPPQGDLRDPDTPVVSGAKP